MSEQSASYFQTLLRWGYWCGPGYSAGQPVGVGPVPAELLEVRGVQVLGRDYVLRSSLVDEICKRHDIAIGNAEGQPGERQKTLDADLKMLYELAEVFRSSRLLMSGLEESYAIRAAIGFALKIDFYDRPTANFEEIRDALKAIIGFVRLADGTPGSELVDRIFAARGVGGSEPFDLELAGQTVAFDPQSGAQIWSWSGRSLDGLSQENSFLANGFEGPLGFDDIDALFGLGAGIDAILAAAWSQNFAPYTSLSAGGLGEAWMSNLPAFSDVISDDSQIVTVIGTLSTPHWTIEELTGGMSDNGNPLSEWEGHASGLGGSAMAEAYRIMQQTLDSYAAVSEA